MIPRTIGNRNRREDRLAPLLLILLPHADTHGTLVAWAWLPDGYGQISRSYVLGSLGFWIMASLRYTAKFDPFLALDCAKLPWIAPPTLHPGAIQGKEGIKFCHLAILSVGGHVALARRVQERQGYRCHRAIATTRRDQKLLHTAKLNGGRRNNHAGSSSEVRTAAVGAFN